MKKDRQGGGSWRKSVSRARRGPGRVNLEFYIGRLVRSPWMLPLKLLAPVVNVFLVASVIVSLSVKRDGRASCRIKRLIEPIAFDII